MPTLSTSDDSIFDTIPESQEKFSENEKSDETAVKNSARNKRYMELAQNPVANERELDEMVREAAEEAGYDSPRLYHGTGSFGFTRFTLGVIYTTTSSGVAMGYNRGKGFARQRGASSAYVADDGTTKTLLRNAKNATEDIFCFSGGVLGSRRADRDRIIRIISKEGRLLLFYIFLNFFTENSNFPR